jgi:hypothetical protein
VITRVELLTGQEVFERLHKLVSGRGVSVRVGCDELRRLLIDHSVMLAALHKSTSFRVVDPPPKRQRPTLAHK